MVIALRRMDGHNHIILEVYRLMDGHIHTHGFSDLRLVDGHNHIYGLSPSSLGRP
jgi:hypothetical protein